MKYIYTYLFYIWSFENMCARSYALNKCRSKENFVLVPSTSSVRNRIRSSWSNLRIVWLSGKLSNHDLQQRCSRTFIFLNGWGIILMWHLNVADSSWLARELSLWHQHLTWKFQNTNFIWKNKKVVEKSRTVSTISSHKLYVYVFWWLNFACV